MNRLIALLLFGFLHAGMAVVPTAEDANDLWGRTRCKRLTKNSRVGNNRKATCYTIEPPMYYHATLSVTMSYAITEPECSSSKLLVKESDSFTDSYTLLGRSCQKTEVIQVDSLDSDSKKLSLWLFKSTASVTLDFVECEGQTGCEMKPTKSPTEYPTTRPTTGRPSKAPTGYPTAKPTRSPTSFPTTHSPTSFPTTSNPTLNPTLSPTTSKPTEAPTDRPSKAPTKEPTTLPPTTTAPTTSCDVIDASIAGTFVGDSFLSVANVDRCWRLNSGASTFMRLKLQASFPDRSPGCSNDFVMLGEYFSTGPEFTRGLCGGSDASLVTMDTQGEEVVLRLKTDSFITGGSFSLAYEAVPLANKVAAVVCSDSQCLVDTLANKASSKIKKKAKSLVLGNSTEIVIEIDQPLLYMDGPLLVEEGTRVTIRPKSPLTQVILDGQKEIGIIRAGRNSVLTVSNIVFRRGYAQLSRGGAISTAGELHVQGCTFENNYADFGGGAIHVQNENVASTVTSSFFSKNSAFKVEGGAIFLESSSLTLNGNTFEANTANDGSVCFADQSKLTILADNVYSRNLARNVFSMKSSIFNVFN